MDARVPVYFVRTNYNRRQGEHIPDAMWIQAVEQTGGKFFAASDERTLLAAIREIDQVSAGTIKMTELRRATTQVCRLRLDRRALLRCRDRLEVDGAVFPEVSVTSVRAGALRFNSSNQEHLAREDLRLTSPLR